MATVLLMSGGGIKSAVAAARYAKDHNLVLLHLNYGQAASAAERTALVGQLPHLPRAKLMQLSLPHVAELARGGIQHSRPGVVQANSLAQSDRLEEAAQPQPAADNRRGPAESGAGDAEPSSSGDGLVAANVRGLWPALLAVGFQAATRVGAETIVVGLTRMGPGAHVGLPAGPDPTDARSEFLHAFATACDILLGKPRAIQVEAPLTDLSYANVIDLGLRFEIPLQSTWTCVSAGPRACGECDPCRQRQHAFEELGRVDPHLEPMKPGPDGGPAPLKPGVAVARTA